MPEICTRGDQFSTHEVALQLVLAGALMAVTGLISHNNFGEYFDSSRAYLDEGHEFFGTGEQITDLDRRNINAGTTLANLFSLITDTHEIFRTPYGYEEIAKEEPANPWLENTVQALSSLRLLDADKNFTPSGPLQSYKELLVNVHDMYRFGGNDRTSYLSLGRYVVENLPEDALLRERVREYRKTAISVFSAAPTVEIGFTSYEDFVATMEDVTWADKSPQSSEPQDLDSILKRHGTPFKSITQNYYQVPPMENTGTYLANLLGDAELLNDLLEPEA